MKQISEGNNLRKSLSHTSYDRFQDVNEAYIRRTSRVQVQTTNASALALAFNREEVRHLLSKTAPSAVIRAVYRHYLRPER